MSFRSRLAATLLLIAPTVACVRTPATESEGAANAVTPLPIEQVVDRRAPALMQVEGVTMVYVGLSDAGEPCIRVGFASLPHANQDRVPSELEGWPVVVEATGEIRPLSDGK